jgi:hypothetical protein
MNRVGILIALLCAAVLAAHAQQAAGKAEKGNAPAAAGQVPVTKPRSNVKNNLNIVQNPNGSLKCTSGDQPCTKEQLKALIEATKSASAKYGIIKGVPNGVATLEAAPDGSLNCTATDGKKCGASHVDQLNNLAAGLPSAVEPEAAKKSGPSK